MAAPQGAGRSRGAGAIAILRAAPATWGLLAVLLGVGVATQGLWVPAETQPWFASVAYGLPSFEAGRWWTPFTGTFVVVTPLVFVPTVLGLVGMAWAEHRRGTRFVLAWFAFGQLAAIVGTSLFLLVAMIGAVVLGKRTMERFD